jgi:subtilisin family serine protease
METRISSYSIRVGDLIPGTGVDMYILDTGIEIDRPALGGRATNIQGSITSSFCPGEGVGDGGYHGTAVASSAGGVGFGTAEGSNLINVKVLCDNKLHRTTANAVLTAQAVVDAHTAKQDSDSNFRGSVINTSFTAPDLFASFQKGLESAAGVGIVAVASAGNEGEDVLRWPYNFEIVICVGASDDSYNLW